MEKLLKFLNSTKLRCGIILIFLFAGLLFTSAFSYAQTISYELRENLLRLHVVPNSDSEVDQNIKLKIRDEILVYMKDKTSNVKTKEEARQILEDKLDEILNIANNILLENGFTYTATASVGTFDFPTKNYGDISLPSGFYDGLRITLGNAER